MTTAIGDPLGHPGFARGEEEGEEVGEGCYESDSDDDDDVDRYVFLARRPVAPAEASDDDDDVMNGEGGGGCGRKRHLSEILAHAPPAAKKARLHLAAPRGVFEVEEESGSDGTVRSPERFRGGLDQGKKTKKRRRCGGEPQAKGAARGKRSRVADSEASEGSRHRDVTEGQKSSVSAAAAARAPRRFVCSICGRCFGSYQALGGHVHLGHMKKAKNGIAVASYEDVARGSNGDRDMAMVEAADGSAAHGEEKAAVAAIAQESDGDGKKTLHAAACHQDVDSSSGDDSNSNEDKLIGAADHGDHRGDGNVEGEKVTVATGHDGADGNNGNGTERKVAGIGDGNSIVGKTPYRCRVCGKEYLSGKALGGHMRKHRKLSPHNGRKERRSPEVDDGAGHDQEKTAVAASSGESDGDGKKTFSTAACHHDIGSSSGDSNSNEEMFTGAADHGDHRGDGNGTERKAAIGRCHELATGIIGNANSDVHKTQHRCEVCGKEYLSGRALGGHMRMHRKRSPDDGGKDRRSPEVDGIPNQRAVVITGNSRLSETTNPQYGTHFDGRMIGWL